MRIITETLGQVIPFAELVGRHGIVKHLLNTVLQSYVNGKEVHFEPSFYSWMQSSMNLILITIDCLRANHLSCLGYSKKTTPNLDYLVGEGVLFSQAISVGPWIPPSFVAMFTSTYPLMCGGQLYITN